MTEPKSTTQLADDTIRKSFELRNLMLDNTETTDVGTMLKILDSTDRLSLGVKRLQGESEDRTNDSRLIDMTEKLFNKLGQSPFESDPSNEPIDSSASRVPDNVQLPSYDFKKEELSNVPSGMDWETLKKEQEALRPKVDDEDPFK